MNNKVFLFFVLSIVINTGVFSQIRPFDDKPGIEPEIFAPNIITSHMYEWGGTFSPDGREFYFCVKGAGNGSIVCIKKQDEGWLKPKVVSFSGIHYDNNPILSYDNKRMFFISSRPTDDPQNKNRTNLWYVDRKGNGWGEPKLIKIINDFKSPKWVSVSKSGNLYFSAKTDGTDEKNDLYLSKFQNGEYIKPVALPSSINTEKFGEYCPYISPDESYLIFESIGREDSVGEGDMYISRRGKDGKWSEAVHLGGVINSRWNDCLPCFTPDGKYMLYTSDRKHKYSVDKKQTYDFIVESSFWPRQGDFDIYWIDAKILDKYLN